MPHLAAYLTYDGNCAEAFRFYEKALGAKIEMMMTFAESPMKDQVPAGFGDRVMHASLHISGHNLMGSDSVPGMCDGPGGMSGFGLSLSTDNVDEARKLFDALADGGKVTMPLDKTFWAAAFGMVTDRFGVPWMVNCETPG